MKTITKIDILSLGKIQAVVAGTLYLLISIGLNLFALKSPGAIAEMGIPAGIVGILSMTVTGLVMGFLSGLVVALIYNLVSPKVGGIKIDLK